ncbi:MAG: accessory gene regulator B family protein [Clostridiaceae bacterium]|nr:accessory gene regulator B family protein [Clostridiaceae bacterium]
MVQKLSHNISSYLCGELNYSDEKKEVLSYGLQIILGASIKIITIITLAYIFNIFKTTIVASVAFIFFRRIIGGSHCDTFNKCYFLSISLLLLLGLLGKIVALQYSMLLILTIAIYLVAVVITIIWVPMGTEKKTIRNKETRLKIKQKTFLALTTCFLILLFFHIQATSKIVLSSLLGIALAFFLATPLGNRFTRIKFNIGKGEKTC